MSLRAVIRAAAGKPRAADEDPPEDEDRENEPASEEDDPPADEDAEDGDDDPEAEGEDDKEPDAEEDDEDKPAEARARARERKRIRAILSAPAAADHPRQAAHLAFNTDLSSPRAIGILKSAGRPAKGSGFGGRMAREGNPKLGTGATGGGKAPDRLVEFARQQADAKRNRRRA